MGQRSMQAREQYSSSSTASIPAALTCRFGGVVCTCRAYILNSGVSVLCLGMCMCV